MSTQAGLSSPIHYRYSPDVFVGPASLSAETLYVVGGIYGISRGPDFRIDQAIRLARATAD